MTAPLQMPQSKDQLESEQLSTLKKIAPADVAINDFSDLQKIPVIRKADLLKSQRDHPPFGLLNPSDVTHIFQSPGPIYEPGRKGGDSWRFGRFLKAIGINNNDILLNTFSYHFTPAGAMFESAARAVDAIVLPTGPGNSRQQAEVASSLKATAYAGTPDFLTTILQKADEENFDLQSMRYAAVSAGPLFPQLRLAYEERNILCRQCYGTADVGLIAYETKDQINEMFIDDNVIVEIVSPGTGEAVEDGEIGEVVVTVLDAQYPILRFSVGDLSAFAPSSDLRRKIVGWRGRADQATKVKGMFIRPEQVSAMVKRHEGIHKARVEVSHEGLKDCINVKLESDLEADTFSNLVQEALNLRANIFCVEKGSLPKDGVLVADLRDMKN
ncbi:MAG: AMP-binding protein [Lentilitoribacter sp.]